MDKFEIIGGRKLKGRLRVSGSKNAALPCLFATLLTDEKCVLDRVPDLADIETSIRLLRTLGKKVRYQRGKVTIEKGRTITGRAPYDLVRRMRASALVMGPLLARKGKAVVSLPGGCAIGARPINFHLDGFERLGVRISIYEGYIKAQSKRLKGAVVPFPYASVGATENLMMCAVLSNGKTVLKNAAREPEIVDLGRMLQDMGADIKGLGTSIITIQGKNSLKGVRHSVIPDRIEAGTYILATAITKGNVVLEGADLSHLSNLIGCLKKSGLKFRKEKKGTRVLWKRPLKQLNIKTDVYPGFPTDMQAQWIALMSLVKGRGHIKETVFENRFLHVQELLRFGADITLNGRSAYVRGVGKLSGCTAMVSDLRAGAALVLAGLAANGKTTILRVYHLDRGYEKLEQKLKKLGARIRRLSN